MEKRFPMSSSRLKTILTQGGRAAGPILVHSSPWLVEMVGRAGYDFLILDAQHGILDIREAEHLVRAGDTVGIEVLVRVPGLDPATVGRYLDVGARGIVFPEVKTPEEARLAVRSVRYRPEGLRSSCPSTRSVWYQFADWDACYRNGMTDNVVILIIEDREGFENAHEIFEVEGVDGVILGPFDLSSSLGLAGQMNHPEVVQRLERALALAVGRGIAVSVWAPSLKAASGWASKGARLFTPSATSIIREALQQSVRELESLWSGESEARGR